MSARTTVTVRYRPPTRAMGAAAPSRVALHGEVTDFVNGLPMVGDASDADDPAFAVTVDVPIGVYAYKLVVDGVFTLDPEGPRTRSVGGRRNHLLVVGGLDEPFVHAPAAPFIVPEDGGGLRVVVGVRRGAVARNPVVRYSERAGESFGVVTLTHAASEDEHDVYEGRLPISTARVEYQIGLSADEAERAPKLVYTGEGAGDRALADAWRDAVVYTIYVDRFRPAVPRATFREARHAPIGDAYAGGHLDGITQSLDSLVDLGVTALYLTPVHVGESSHRYDFVDPYAVDALLGGEGAFARLVRECQVRNLRLLVDVSFSHAGKSFPPAADVMAKGRASAFADWFLWDGGMGDAPTLRHYGRRTDAPLVNLAHPEVQAMVLEAVDRWGARGVDGLRLDMLAEVPLGLARAIRTRLRRARPTAVILGELVPEHAWRWLAAEAVDLVTDFGFHGAATELAASASATPARFVAALADSARARGVAGSRNVRFLSTHDHPRFMTLLRASGVAYADRRAKLAYLLLFTMPGVPALLYGEELGLSAPRATLDPENVWEDRMPMPWSGDDDGDELPPSEVRPWMRALIALRQGAPALRRGELTVLHADDTWLAFRRSHGTDVVDVVVSFGEATGEIMLTDDVFGALTPCATVGDAVAVGDVVTLGPFSALVAQRRLVAASQIAPRVAHNVTLRDRDAALAYDEAHARPTRLDFAVTEVCNLRCAHCITFAPDRTREGTARTLSPWVIASLLDDLRYAEYCGFVHGGESLTAPTFFELLAALRAARGSLPYVAHLLTNGIALTPSTVARLVGHGVSSISVSLDGATAATNDAVRLGGRFETIGKNVRAAVSYRADTNADLRIGISFVVLATNVHEVVPMVDLAAHLGVDWLKLEEGVGVNAFSRRSLVGLTADRLRDAVAAAKARAAHHGIVVVDHTLDRPQAGGAFDPNDDEARAFRRADEFANRSVVDPRRAPWEIACIEPDGDARLGHFFGPVLGNVTRTPLTELWNARAARIERARSRSL